MSVDRRHAESATARLLRFRPGSEAVYCVLKRELPRPAVRLAHKHFRDERSIVVLTDRRRAERRQGVAPVGRLAGRPLAGQRVRGRRRSQRRSAISTGFVPVLPARLLRQLHLIEFMRHAPLDGEDDKALGLVERLRKAPNDRVATEELYMLYFDRVYRYLCGALRNEHDAEDIAQDAFSRAFRSLQSYSGRAPFRAWLFSITRNCALDHLRNSRRTVPVDPGELVPARETAADQRTLVMLSNIEFLDLVEQLPPTPKQVLVMRFLLGLKPAEIAALTEQTPANVRKIQSRAIAALGTRTTKDELLAGATLVNASRRRHRPMPVLLGRRFALAFGWCM